MPCPCLPPSSGLRLNIFLDARSRIVGALWMLAQDRCLAIRKEAAELSSTSSLLFFLFRRRKEAVAKRRVPRRQASVTNGRAGRVPHYGASTGSFTGTRSADGCCCCCCGRCCFPCAAGCVNLRRGITLQTRATPWSAAAEPGSTASRVAAVERFWCDLGAPTNVGSA